MGDIKIKTDALGKVEVPADRLWGAQTQRSREHFSIGHDLMPREMITAYAILKRTAAAANHAGGRPAQRRPVRIHFDDLSQGIAVAAGMTSTVQINTAAGTPVPK
jgi:fumarate hydratase class II